MFVLAPSVDTDHPSYVDAYLGIVDLYREQLHCLPRGNPPFVEVMVFNDPDSLCASIILCKLLHDDDVKTVLTSVVDLSNITTIGDLGGTFVSFSPHCLTSTHTTFYLQFCSLLLPL